MLKVEAEPMPVPDSPLPLLNVPVKLEAAHDTDAPVLVSVRIAVPDVAVKCPPGLTVQVVAANADLGYRLVVAAKTATMARTIAALDGHVAGQSRTDLLMLITVPFSALR